jgi:hypothetical protein
MDNYFLKKQLLGEIQEAIRFKDLNIEFLELTNIDKLGKAAN